MKTSIDRVCLGGLAAALLTASSTRAQCPAADAFEDNDDCANAVVIASGTYTNLTANGIANVGGEDADFYEVTVPAGEILQVDCLHGYLNGDMDTYLYDAASPSCGDQVSYLVRGWTSSDDETWTWANTTGAAATYIVEVDPWDSDTDFDCNGYTLVVTTFPDPCANPTDDTFEENDGCGSAVALAAGAHGALFVSDTDEDYYLVSVPAGEILTVDVSYLGATDVDLELFDDLACANQVDFSFSAAGAGTAEWSNTTGAAATVVMRVAVDTATGTCNNYSLNVATAPDPCLDPLADDGLENNDDCANALPMVDGLTTGLFVSKADEDFYEVSVADGDMLTVDLLFTHATADVDVYLYDDAIACGALNGYLTRGFSASDNESISWTNTSGGVQTYWIQVVVYVNSGGDCNDYDLQITGSAGSVATPMCAGDGTVGGCPCGNESTLGAEEGCNSSLGFGAKIAASGTASVANDDLVFSISQAVPNQPSLLVQGSVVIAVPFKDGLLCMGNPTERVQVVFLDASGEGATTASIVTEGNVSAGDTRHYQFWYRNPGGVSPCGSGSNFSAGATVVFQP